MMAVYINLQYKLGHVEIGISNSSLISIYIYILQHMINASCVKLINKHSAHFLFGIMLNYTLQMESL